MSQPRFAVIGPPNKGKSSIVAALARDDSVTVSATPGTTTLHHEYPMQVDGQILYTLFDTPGFQRARRVLSWLKETNSGPADRPATIQRFIDEHQAQGMFPDECELLAPLTEPCGILYVVDGSVPYGPEYEAEMEILQWTGRPRMALINQISPADHVEEWKTALGQFFNLTRVFNARTADFQRQVDLLDALGELDPSWKPSLQSATGFLQSERQQRLDRASDHIADMLEMMLTHRVEKEFDLEKIPESEIEKAQQAFEKRLQDEEVRCRRRVEELYHHLRIQRIEDALPVLKGASLFSDEAWRIFGLSRRTLASLGAASGALAGGVIDLAVGGSSLLAGTLIGASAGAVTSFFGSRKLAKAKVLSLTLGMKQLVLGPVQNPQFAHVVLERARLHHQLVANRSHAMRDQLDMTSLKSELCPPLEGETLKALDKEFRNLAKDSELKSREDFRQLVSEALTQ